MRCSLQQADGDPGPPQYTNTTCGVRGYDGFTRHTRGNYCCVEDLPSPLATTAFGGSLDRQAARRPPSLPPQPPPSTSPRAARRRVGRRWSQPQEIKATRNALGCGDDYRGWRSGNSKGVSNGACVVIHFQTGREIPASHLSSTFLLLLRPEFFLSRLRTASKGETCSLLFPSLTSVRNVTFTAKETRSGCQPRKMYTHT